MKNQKLCYKILTHASWSSSVAWNIQPEIRHRKDESTHLSETDNTLRSKLTKSMSRRDDWSPEREPKNCKSSWSNKFNSFPFHSTFTFLFGYMITSTLLFLKHFMVIHYYTIKQNWNLYRWDREPTTPWRTGNQQRAYRLAAATRSGCKYNREGKFLNQRIPMILLKSCLFVHWIFQIVEEDYTLSDILNDITKEDLRCLRLR